MFKNLLIKNLEIFLNYDVDNFFLELSLNGFNYLFIFLNNNFKYYEDKIINLNDDYIRCKADIENLKKRSNEEVSKTYRYAIEDFSEDLLFIADSLESAINDKSNKFEKLNEGVRLTLNLLKNSFNKNNIKKILPKIGDKFNPYEHLAISTLKLNNIDNTILNVLQKGYIIFEKVLRPALVVVNKI